MEELIKNLEIVTSAEFVKFLQDEGVIVSFMKNVNAEAHFKAALCPTMYVNGAFVWANSKNPTNIEWHERFDMWDNLDIKWNKQIRKSDLD